MTGAAVLAATLGPLESRLVGVFDDQVVLPLAVVAAAVLGAGHAVAPGHGKTLVAGYLVAGKARLRDALLLGAVVATMHTASVSGLAVGWYLLGSASPDLAALTRWLQLVAALIVVALGASLLRRHLNHRGAYGHTHSHAAASIVGGPEHSHGHAGARPPGAPPADTALLSRRGLVLLGMSGGLLPSPAAFLVLLTGLLSGRELFAVLLVTAFGVGMAVTLSGVAVAVLHSRDRLLNRFQGAPRLSRLAARSPLVAAIGVLTGGVLLSLVTAQRAFAT